jgi:hypothetical protein
MSDSPNGATPRGTMPLGLGPIPSLAAPCPGAREERAAVRPPALGARRRLVQERELPTPAPTVEPHRRAQLSGSVAPAPRAPALRAPVRLRGARPAPLLARLALARFSAPPAPRIALAVLAPLALVLKLSARPAASSQSCADGHVPEPRREREPPSAPPVASAVSAPEPAAPADPTSASRSAPPPVRAARAPSRANDAARPGPTSDVVDPWRQ